MNLLLAFGVLAGTAVFSEDDRGRLGADARRARQEWELARSNTHYFVLDTPARALRLKLRGLELRSYRLEAIEVGTPLGGARDPDWMDRVCDLEPRPLPPRAEIEPPLPGSAPPAEPAPEVAGASTDEPVPLAFTMTCGPALSLRIVSASVARGWITGIVQRWGGGLARGAVRLRLTLSDEEASSLYRSWPERSRLIVIPPSP
jgi:hypothetical protein